MTPVPEEQLFERFRRGGDADALAEVFDRTAPELYRVASHLVRDPHLAEDLVQTTFLRAIDGADRFDATQRLLPWLLGILANRARYWLRERNRQLRAATERAPRDPADLAAERELSEATREAIRGLAEPYRHVLVLHLEHGLTPKEIGDAHDRPASTVRTQIARGLDLLRSVLPAGFAAAVIGSALPAQRLAEIRATVLEHAAGATVSAGLPFVTALGALTMKPVLAICAVAIASLAWILGRPDPATSAIDIGPAPATDAVAAELDTPSRPPEVERAAAETDTAPSTGAIRVRVLWKSDRTPAAGVGVRVYGWDGINGRVFYDEGATDRDGRIAWAAVTPGRISVAVDRSGRLRGDSRSFDLSAGATRELTLSIAAGVEVRGRVVDWRGDPVGGATVWLHAHGRKLGTAVATSDALGRFALRDVQSKRVLQARATGYAPSYGVEVDGDVGAAAEVELVLPAAGGSIAGTVLGPDGRPADRAVVVVVPGAGPKIANGVIPAPAPFRLRTDRDGRFAADGLDVGTATVFARAVDTGTFEGRFPIEANQTTTVVCQLLEEAVLVGQVVDAEGTGLAGVSVETGRDPDDDRACVTVTGADGSFELRGLTAGTRTVRAVDSARGRDSAQLELVAGATTEHVFRLTPPTDQTIEGRVLTVSGRPLGGYLVELWPSQITVPWRGTARTDDDGFFTVDGCPFEQLDVHVIGPTKRQVPLLVRGPIDPAGELVVRVPDELLASATIRASVVGALGEPVDGATLTYHPVGRTVGHTSPFIAGDIVVRDLPPVELDLSIGTDQGARRVLGRYRLEPGSDLDLGTVRLEPLGTLVASIATDDGAPTFCSIVSERQFVHFEQSKGSLRVELFPGEYLLNVRSGKSEPRTVPFTIESDRETTVACGLRPGTRRTFFIECAGDWRYMDVEVRDQAGELEHSHLVLQVHGTREPVELWLTLGRGVHRVIATAANGARAETQVAIDELVDDSTPIRLVAR